MIRTDRQAGREGLPWAGLMALAGIGWQLLKGKVQIVLVFLLMLLLVPLIVWKWLSVRHQRPQHTAQAVVDTSPGV